MSRIRILLCGASGRMGGEVIKLVSEAEDLELIGGVVGNSDPHLGKRLAGIPEVLCSEWSSNCPRPDVIIDFSTPQGTLTAMDIAQERQIPIVVSTTGLASSTEERIETFANLIPVVRANNMSVGVTAMLELVARAAVLLGDDYDCEISEIHHRFKKDAPSGTAKSLADAVASAYQRDPSGVITNGRVGLDVPRGPNEIGVQAIRGGNVPGEHTVYFLGENERIEITHRAQSRAIFAEGAVRAARWLTAAGRKPGLYRMRDVLS